MEKLMKRYALTRQGAKDFIICTIVTTIQNIMLMAPVAILYYITSDLISGSISKSNNVAYIISVCNYACCYGYCILFSV